MTQDIVDRISRDQQQIYVVSYANGSSGNLVKALLERMVLPYMPFGPWTTNEVNSAHVSSEYSNHRLNPQATITNPNTEFLATELITPALSAFIGTHYYDPSVIRTKFPGVRMIVITHTEEDIEEITINWLYKHITLQQNGGLIFTGFSLYTPTPWVGLNDKDFRTFTAQEKLQTVKFFKGATINYGFHLLGTINEPDVVELKYRDIVTDPTTVWQALSQSTGTEPTDDAQNALVDYQTKQQAFLAQVRTELGL